MQIETGGRNLDGEVVRIDEDGAILKPFESRIGAGLGSPAYRVPTSDPRPCEDWKDRVINALGQPIDGKGPLAKGARAMPLDADPPPAMLRSRVNRPLPTGVRAMDLFTPLCAAQRIGIFAGSGVGKTTLLSMLARCSGFDAVVVALVGERGREVREFLEGPVQDSRSRSVVVVATGDESPMMRRQAPKLAFAVAEYFRDQGQSVLLILDSVTRFAHAAREVALAAGEPPVARGYPPSVFGDLPRLLERAGPGTEGGGTITGIFSVLIDGDDHNDPVADSIRGTLDGHIVLDRAIADQGRYPAINLLGSISRLADVVWTLQQRELVRMLKSLVARFEDSRDLRQMGDTRPERIRNSTKPSSWSRRSMRPSGRIPPSRAASTPSWTSRTRCEPDQRRHGADPDPRGRVDRPCRWQGVTRIRVARRRRFRTAGRKASRKRSLIRVGRT